MSISCASNSTKNTANVAANATKGTELQKLFASKGVKLISENNPIVLHKFTADPCVLVYNDTVYIYGTNDSQQAETCLGTKDNSYEKINSLNVFSSKDLVNWTDHGIIKVGGKNGGEGPAKWATNSWAPAICTKKINGKDKFFLYFADSANGIGVLSADSPLGPFVDPIGKALVSRSEPNIKGVHWLFDPAVLVDDDGTGYLYFGGGVQDDVPHPKSARVVKLNDDMISLACEPVELDPPYLFEDSGINKINGKYYYSYCANWADRKDFPGDDVPPIATICYMMSDSPMGPFKFMGWTLKNPGTYFGPWGNNHHWLFELKGKYYMAYHAQIVEKTLGFEKGGYRNLLINDFVVNADGTFPIQNCKKDGVEPVALFNPFETIPAATMHSSKNVVVTDDLTLSPLNDGSYICIKNVGFKNASKVKITVAPNHKGGTVTFRVDNFAGGEEIAKVQIGSETTATSTVTLPASADGKNLYLVFEGDVELVNWCFE